MMKRRVSKLEAQAWERMKARFDAMSEQEVIHWMDEYYGVESRVWCLAYLDGCSPEELETLGAPPDPHSTAQQRFNAAYA